MKTSPLTTIALVAASSYVPPREREVRSSGDPHAFEGRYQVNAFGRAANGGREPGEMKRGDRLKKRKAERQARAKQRRK